MRIRVLAYAVMLAVVAGTFFPVPGSGQLFGVVSCGGPGDLGLAVCPAALRETTWSRVGGVGAQSTPPEEYAPRLLPIVLGSAAGLGLGVLAGSQWCNNGGCIFKDYEDPGLGEAILLGGVGAILGATLGACMPSASKCPGSTLPKSVLGALAGLAGGALAVALVEGSGVGGNGPAFIVGFSVTHGLALKRLLR